MKIKFKKLGMDNERLNDIKNFRIMSEKFKSGNGEDVVLEISLNHQLEKQTGNKYIYAKKFIYNDNGSCNGDCKFEKDVVDAKIEYYLVNVLNLVNLISVQTFTGIEFV